MNVCDQNCSNSILILPDRLVAVFKLGQWRLGFKYMQRMFYIKRNLHKTADIS
ncbi:hypothetical protein ATG66_2149 [Vibrio sp. ES.051]|nr:hypothetical protein ATG66_2149 [Vibrio sp. ES.051]